MNENKVEAKMKKKLQEDTKELKPLLGAIQFLGNSHRNFCNEQINRDNFSKKTNHRNENRNKKKTITRMKQTLTEGPCLASYVKDKDNKITTNSSTTGLGITLWQKQNDGKIEPTAYRREFSEHSGKKKSIGEIKLLAVDW